MKKVSVLLIVGMFMMMLAGLTVAGAADGELKGKVLEVLESGGYTYAQIDMKGAKIWVAVPQTKIEKGKVASFQPGMLMENFKSKTMDRTFDKIYFSNGLIK